MNFLALVRKESQAVYLPENNITYQYVVGKGCIGTGAVSDVRCGLNGSTRHWLEVNLRKSQNPSRIEEPQAIPREMSSRSQRECQQRAPTG